MKLYTEEQVRSMLNRAKIFDGKVKSNFVFILSEQDILASETPIELPSDEEIEKAALKHSDNIQQHIGWDKAIEWVIDKIKNQQL